MSRRSRRFAVAAALLALAACGGAGERAARPPGPVTVGVVTPLSGEAEALGLAVRQGAELALAEAEGTPIRLVFADAGDRAQTAAEALAGLIDEGAQAVIGGVDPAWAGALADAAGAAGVALVIAGDGAGTAGSEGSTEVFRLGPVPERGARLVRALLAAHPAWRRLALVCSPDPEGEALAAVVAEAAAAAGRVVVEPESRSRAEAGDSGGSDDEGLDRPPAPTADDDLAADVTVLCGDAAAVAARAGAGAPGGPVLALAAGADPVLFDPAARTAAGLALRAVPGGFDDEGGGGGGGGEDAAGAIDRFARGYAERYGEPADAWAAFGHDAAALIARAAGEGRSSLAESMRALGPTAGALGVTRFDRGGSARSALHLVAAQGASRLPVWLVGTGLPTSGEVRLARRDPPAQDPSGMPVRSAEAAAGAPTREPAVASHRPIVALYDFQGAERPLAAAVVENLRAEGWTVRLSPATARSGLPRLGSAHLYRRQETAEALDAAAAIAIAAGMDVRMHPWMETGQEDIRQVLREDDEADFVIVLN